MMDYNHNLSMKKIIVLSISVFMFSTIFLFGCYKDKEEVLYPTDSSCDVSTSISYSSQIVPIVSTYCYSCHGASVYNSTGGNVNLEGYDNFVSATQNGLLLKSIKREEGASPMPKNSPKLSDCNIKLIENWINQGAANN